MTCSRMAAACTVLAGRRNFLLPRQLPNSPFLGESTHHAVCRLLPSSSISSASAPKGDLPLLSSVRSQLEREKQVSSLQDLISRNPPEPFKLVDGPNAQEVVLRRTFGVEDIEIACVFHDQTFGENDGEEDFGPPPPPTVPMKMVQMTIKISTGNEQPFLEIVCCTYGNKQSIEQVLLKDHETKLKEAPFEGPDISMLSDKVKSGFVQYLEARGIDNELGKFLLKYVPQSTQQKNACWLAKVERFLKA